MYWHNKSHFDSAIVGLPTIGYVCFSKRNILRRKRQNVNGRFGNSSAIISSSLVVGDSLDATIVNEVEVSWGETDITLSGFDMATENALQYLSMLRPMSGTKLNQIKPSQILEGQQHYQRCFGNQSVR